MRWLVIFAISLTALILPAPAGAATLSNSGGVLTYTGDSDVSDITFTGGPNVNVQRNAGDNDTISSSNGCSPVTAQQFTCNGVNRIVVDSGGGNDTVSASGVVGISAAMSGGTGNDTLSGTGLDDTLNGDDGVDTLEAGAGNDTVNGGTGNDAAVDGDDGNDTVNGGEGDDQLSGGLGTDVISGGDGIDHVTFDAARPSVDVTLDGSPNDGAPGEADNVLADVEDVTASADGNGAVNLVGSSGGNVLDVDRGAGNITGGAGADLLYGGPQDDTIDARDGYPDRVVCGAGNDTAQIDTLDTVSQCENAPVTVVPGGADDRPPAIAWTAPADRATFAGNVLTTLAVDAADDRGVAKVQFFDDDRLLCEDAEAPYTCTYQARAADVGRNTLIATAIDGAGQAGSGVRLINVTRFKPSSLSLSLSPRRDRRSPYSFRARGALTGAGECSGRVTVTAKAGRRTVSSRRVRLNSACRYSARLRFHSRPARRLRISARFGGNDSTLPRSARARSARLGR